LIFIASDGRVIVFGGVSKQSVPALPHLSVLDTSKIPYEWSTPTVENPIGAFSGHTSVMVKNYMISAFGIYDLLVFKMKL
jgi:hypothetical protein